MSVTNAIEKSEHFTTEDDYKSCPHCKEGVIKGNCCDDRIIYWCDNCGANNKKTPPSVNLEFTK